MVNVIRLRRRVSYDRATGELFWKCDPPKGRKVGERLPVRDNGNGYLYASFEGRGYGVHRLAWAIETGVWPATEIDHRDLNKTNNSWGNLRIATRSQNEMNAARRADNKSGYKGVGWHKQKNRWRAYIQKDGKHISLGYHATAEAAHSAYVRAAKVLFGDFARAG